MKKASIHVLLIEELTDLLYELNDVYNLQNEVECKHKEFFNYDIRKAILFTGFAIEYASASTETPRSMKEVLASVMTAAEVDGYVDRGDLMNVTEKAHSHSEHMRLAYCGELDEGACILLKIIKLYLEAAKYYIHGRNL